MNSTFTAAQEENRRCFKENIHKTSEQIDKMGNWKYLFGIVPQTVQALDKSLND